MGVLMKYLMTWILALTLLSLPGISRGAEGEAGVSALSIDVADYSLMKPGGVFNVATIAQIPDGDVVYKIRNVSCVAQDRYRANDKLVCVTDCVLNANSLVVCPLDAAIAGGKQFIVEEGDVFLLISMKMPERQVSNSPYLLLSGGTLKTLNGDDVASAVGVEDDDDSGSADSSAGSGNSDPQAGATGSVGGNSAGQAKSSGKGGGACSFSLTRSAGSRGPGLFLLLALSGLMAAARLRRTVG